MAVPPNPFTFSGLMQNPMFQFGASLFGSSSPKNRPLLEAFQMLRQSQQQEQEAEMRKLQMEMYGEQVATSKRNTKLAEEQAKRDQEAHEDFLQTVKTLLSMQNQQQVPRPQPTTPSISPQSLVGPQPQGMEEPFEPVGKYGTPLWLLQGLAKTESNNNPLALGPDLGRGERAQGAYQFRPGTTAMLKKEGINFDPFKPLEARDAADYYIQKLRKEHGSYEQALAAYGGFKSKDPTSYINKVMQGSPEKQAKQLAQNQAQQQVQQQAEQNFGQLQPHQLAAIKAGIYAKTPSEKYRALSEVLKPQTHRPGDVIETPFGSRTIPDPAREAEQGFRSREVAIKEEAEARAKTEAAQKAEATARGIREGKAKDLASFQTSINQLEQTQSVIGKLLQDPNLPKVTGRYGLMPKNVAVALDPKWGSTISDIDQVSSAQIIDMLQNIRKTASTGASGFGQFQQFEKEMFQAVQGLERTRDSKEFRNKLVEVNKVIDRYKQTAGDVYKSTYGEGLPSAYEGLPPGTRYMGIDPESGKPYYQTPSGKFVRAK